MTDPVISVVCPTHNRSRLIEPTIRSVLEQTVRDIELIVVADGCTDDTVAVVAELAAADRRVRLVETPAHGHPAEPRNRGVAEADGDLIAYLDHDDLWAAGHLAELLALFEEGADVAFTGCVRNDRATGASSPSTPFGSTWHPWLQVMNPIFEPSRAAHRRALLAAVGGWADGPGLEDWDLWQRFTDGGARFVSSIAPTAIVSLDTATRRHRTPRPHRLRLGGFDAPRDAATAARELTAEDTQRALISAAMRDAGALLPRLAAGGGLVLPHGWEGRLADLPDGNGALATHTLDTVVVQRGRGFEVQLPLWCRTVEHAERFWRGVRQDHSEQWTIVAEVMTRGGGRVLGGIDQGEGTYREETAHVAGEQ